MLVVNGELPLHDQDAGSGRLRRYIELMVAEDHRVTFLARAWVGQDRYVVELRDLGVEVHAFDARGLRASGHAIPGFGIDLRLLLRRGRFDVAYLSSFDIAEQYLPDIRAHSPVTRIVIDPVDVHDLRQRPGIEVAADGVAPAAAPRMRLREAKIYSQADLLVAVSEDDSNALRELSPDVPIETLSHVHGEVPAPSAGSGHSVAAELVSLRRLFRIAAPASFVARAASWSPPAIAMLVRSYIGAFAEHDAVTLVVPVTPAEPDVNAVGALLVRAIEEAGASPEHVPDIVVMPCAEDPPLPSRAVLVDASSPDCPPTADRTVLLVTVPARSISASAPASEWTTAAFGQQEVDVAGPRISIIVIAYGKREVTENCLAALERDLGDRLGSEIELVLVDNGSRDSTPELFKQWSSRATLVELAENRNYAGGANAGARAARGKVLVLINNDIEVGPGAIDALVEEVEQPSVGLVGARLCYPDGRLQHGGFAWVRSPSGLVPFHLFHYEAGTLPITHATLEIGAVTGACSAFRADLFWLVGGYDEGYVNGWEDVDLCFQIRSAGASVRYRGDVDIVHHEGATTGQRYNENGNPRRFFARWGSMLTDDAPLIRDALGASLSPISGFPVSEEQLDGAAVRVIGAVAGLGPDAAEARGVLRALQHGGIDVAARTIAATWIGPSLDELRWHDLARAHLRAARPDAITVSFGDDRDAAVGPWIVRAGGGIARRPEDAVAWASCPAVRDRLLEQGWPHSAIDLVPPAGIETASGLGGAGVLFLAPTHDRRLTTALLAALRHLGDTPVRVLPSVRTPDIHRALRDALPHAELLQPVTDERTLGALAAESDLVIAVDPTDTFDRLALTAAAAGAAVAVRPDGPAAWVLRDLAVVVDASALAFPSAALGLDHYDTALPARRSRAAAVLQACGTRSTALALQRLLAPQGLSNTRAA